MAKIKQLPAVPNTPRRFCLTPGYVLVVLLTVEAILLLSEWFHWFSFNEKKGWTVLIAVANVGLFLLFAILWFLLALIFRKRFQFSVRSLLMLPVAIAIPFSWLAVEMGQARKQKVAVEELVKLGCKVNYNYNFDSSGNFISKATPPGPTWLRTTFGEDFVRKVTHINSYKSNMTILDLKYLEGLNELQSLTLAADNITDAGFEHIKELKHLQTLQIQYTLITGAGMKYLEGMQKLHTLILSNNRITDEGLEQVKSLDSIQHLDLSGNLITDTGLGHLKELHNLHYLNLSGNPITDTGLENLKGLSQLQTLSMEYTKITDVGLEHLKGIKTLRNIYFDGTTISDSGFNELQESLPEVRKGGGLGFF